MSEGMSGRIIRRLVRCEARLESTVRPSIWLTTLGSMLSWRQVRLGLSALRIH